MHTLPQQRYSILINLREHTLRYISVKIYLIRARFYVPCTSGTDTLRQSKRERDRRRKRRYFRRDIDRFLLDR